MPVFQEMDPQVAWRVIEQYTDELTPAAEDREVFYGKFRCPRCRCKLKKEFDARTVFDPDDPIARALLRCENCRYLIDPHVNVIVEYGDASKTPIGRIPLLGEK